jgi:hypothetical protein
MNPLVILLIIAMASLSKAESSAVSPSFSSSEDEKIETDEDSQVAELENTLRRLWIPGNLLPDEKVSPPTREEIVAMNREVREAFLPQISTKEFRQKIHSSDAETVKDVCIHLRSIIDAGVPFDRSVFDLEKVIKHCTAAFCMVRNAGRFKEFLQDARVMNSTELDVQDIIWCMRATLQIVHHKCSTVADLPAARGYSYMAGEIFRHSVDKRVFDRLFPSQIKEPLQCFDSLLKVIRVTATTANVPKNDETVYYRESKDEITGVDRRVEVLTDLRFVDRRRFIKLASRYEYAILRAQTFLSVKLVYCVDPVQLYRRVRRITDMMDDSVVRTLIGIGSSGNAADKIAIALALPLMARDDAILRTKNENLGAAIILNQSIGVALANLLRHEHEKSGFEVLKNPRSHYFDAWVLVIFDNLVNGDLNIKITERCLVLDHQFASERWYSRLSNHDPSTGDVIPFIVRILHSWYISVTVAAERLPQDVLVACAPVPENPKQTILIQCGDINECVCLWYLIVKHTFRGKLGHGIKLGTLKQLFDVPNRPL